MSIANRIQAINDHLIDDYKVLRLAGADLSGVNKNIVNLKMSWKERLLYFMNYGTDIVWNNWNKVNGTGTTLSLNNTEEAPMSLTYKGNTSQSGTPTPSSPQDIHVVSGNNSIEVVGKNLFNPSEVIANQLTTISNDNITITDNSGWGRGHIICGDKIKAGTYTISTIGNNVQLIVMARGYINNEVYTSLISGGAFYSAYYQATTFGTTTNNIITITLPNTCDYYYIGFALGSNGTETFKVEVEKGNQATTYEEYKSASYPINLPEGMFLGWIPNTNYQDSIFNAVNGDEIYDNLSSAIKETLQYGSWYVEKKVGKVVLDGTEYWGEYTTQIGGYRTYTDTVKIGLSGSFQYEFYCDYFDHVAYANVNNIGITMYALYLNIDSSVANTIAGLKTWLSTHKPTIWYPLSTPTYEYITDTTLLSQLEALKKSYESVTNISQVNNDMPFELNITALSNE